MPVLPLFTVASISFILIVQHSGPLSEFLASRWTLHIGQGCVALGISLAVWPGLPRQYKYDLFALGTLMIWFSYWRTFFRLDAPLFHFYPVYFALLTCLFALFIVHRRHYFDADTLSQLNLLYRLDHFKAPVLGILTLASLYFPEHFLMYPLMLSLFILRYAIGTCFETAS